MSTRLEMVLEAIDRASGPIGGVVDQVDRLERASGRSSGRMSQAMRAIGTAAAAAAATGVAALTGAIVAATNEAIKFQDLWSDANKTLGFSDAEMPGFQDAVNELSTRVPIARDAIVKMTGDAGRLGIKGKEALVDFVELSAVTAAAFDVDPSHMAQMFGNLRETMGYSTEQLEAWSDKVNWLGNNTAASEADIASYASAVQGIAREAGLAEDATLALGASMIAAGRAPEVAVTGLRAFLRTMQKGWGDLSKGQRGGLTKFWDDLAPPQALAKAEEFMDGIQKMMLTDAEGAIRLVSEKISSLPEHMRGAFVSEFFGEEAGRALGPLLTNAEALEDALARMEQFGGGKVAGAMREEFAGATDDVLDNWQKLKNAMSIRSEEIGIPMLDPINAALKETTDLLMTLDERATLFTRMGAGLEGFASGLGLTGEAAGGLKALLDDLWTSVSEFLFGVADAEASADTIGRIFHNAQAAGESLRGALDGLKSALSGLDFAGRFAPLKELVSGNLESLGEVFTNLGSGLVTAFGDGSGARAAFDWLANLTLDGIAGVLETYAGAQARLLAVLKDFSAWFSDSAGAIDWTALIPADGIDTGAIDAIGRAILAFVDAVAALAVIAGKGLVEYFKGYFEGLLPYLEPMREKLGGIASALGGALSNMADAFEAIAGALGLMSGSDMSGLQSFGEVMGTIAGVVGNLALGTLLALAKWVETMAGAIAKLAGGDFSGAASEFKDFFSWLSDFVLPDVDIAGYLSAFGDAFTGLVTIVEEAWTRLSELFGQISSAATDLAATIKDALTFEMPNLGISDTASSVWAGVKGAFSSDETAPEIAPPAIATPTAPMPDMAAVQAAQATVDALAADAAAAEAAVAALGPQAQAIVAEVQGAMTAVEAAASLNLFDKGVAMMDTLAAGMRSRAQAAVEEMRNLAQQLRDHLPSSPAKVGPLSDIHRLKFGETIAQSIRPEPVVRAMRGLTAAARAEMGLSVPSLSFASLTDGSLGPAGLDGGLREMPRLPSGTGDIRLPVDEEHEKNMVRRMARISETGPSAGGGGASGGTRTIDASMHIGTVNYRTEADRDDFEARLSQHRQLIAELVGDEDRRKDRLRF